MATATAMYHSGKNPLHKVTRSSEEVRVPKGLKMRRLHKAFLRYHDANNWPLLRAALRRMGRADLIGNGRHHLVPLYQPAGTGSAAEGAGTPKAGKRGVFRTQHTGLPIELPSQRTRRRASGSRRPPATLNPGSPSGCGKRR
jgi:hypothetical protein